MQGLPVHRIPGGTRPSVYAIGHELDVWLTGLDGGAEVEHPAGPAAGNHSIGRRALVIGTLAATSAGVLGLAGFRFRKTEISAEAIALVEQARLLRGQHTLETQNQAIGLTREAVRLSPDYAEAWGMYGYACAAASHWRKQSEADILREQATIAGQRALDIDPRSVSGELALACALPLLGTNDWLARENGLRRALDYEPANPDALTDRAFIFRFTGHPASAANLCERIDPRHYTPVVFNIWSRALWSAGQVDEAKRKIDAAFSMFPGHKTLWFTRLEILIFSGGQELAARILADARQRPSTVPDEEVRDFKELVQSVRRGNPVPGDSAMQEPWQRARAGVRNGKNALRLASASGRLDDAFALADAYFFARGFSISDDAGAGLFVPLNQRHTNFLFEPPAAPMRADPRFALLTEELGLERYWRQVRLAPHYRRDVSESLS